MAYIGIVVPVYSIKKEYLRQCVDSLRHQTFRDIQIILVDDGSPDDCGELCDGYIWQDDRITVVHHDENRGLPAARNTGLEALDAQWVTFVDGDDWLDLNTCESMFHYLEKWTEEPDIIIFSGYRNYPDKEMKNQAVFTHETWFDTYEKICNLQRKSLSYAKREYAAQALNLDSACWKLISTRYIKEKDLRFIEVPYREDGLYFLYSTEQARKIVYLDETFYHYRSTGNSMVNMYRPNADAEHRIYLNEVSKFIHRFRKDDAFIHDFYYAVFISMQICITQKFYSGGNTQPLAKRRSACRKYFKQEPYASVFRYVDIRTLRRNHMLKAICMKLRCYAGVTVLRNIYNKLQKKQTFS